MLQLLLFKEKGDKLRKKFKSMLKLNKKLIRCSLEILLRLYRNGLKVS